MDDVLMQERILESINFPHEYHVIPGQELRLRVEFVDCGELMTVPVTVRVTECGQPIVEVPSLTFVKVKE
jgi:hypothetical protein